MKVLAAFEYVKVPVLAAASPGAERLGAYDALRTMTKAAGLKSEAKELNRIIHALRRVERLQFKFAPFLDGKNGKDGQ